MFRFRITNKHLKPNQTTKNVRSVRVDISRYGKYYEIIHFDNPVTEKEAIDAAELYLSESVSSEHYEKVKDDLYDEVNDFSNIRKGDLLSGKVYLDDMRRRGRFNLELILGS